MISRPAFSRLNVKQKVLKISDAVRSAEVVFRATGVADTADILTYAGWLDNETHPRLHSARDLLQKYILNSLPDRPALIRRALNFCFHELTVLNGMPESGEESFLAGPAVANFDKTVPEVHTPQLESAAILDNLRSPFNVGSMFRTADAFGVGSLALCGITPRPPMPKLEKTAMGSVARVRWTCFENTLDAVADFRSKGYRVWALETFPTGAVIPRLESAEIPEKSAFIFGNEEFGITEDVLSAADSVLTIPLDGFKNSLNVASVFAVVFYEIRRRRLKGV